MPVGHANLELPLTMFADSLSASSTKSNACFTPAGCAAGKTCSRVRRSPPASSSDDWRGLKVSCTVSLDVPCLRSCSTPMLVSASSDSVRYPARCLLLASRAFRFPALLPWSSLMCRPLVFFEASSCLSTHRSDRRYLQPLPQLLQCPWAHNSAESSSHPFRVRVGASMYRSAIFAVIILLSAATLTVSWAYLLRLPSCPATRSSQSMMSRCNSSIDFALDGAMMPAMDTAPTLSVFGRCHLFRSCRAQRPTLGNSCIARKHVCQLHLWSW